MGVPYAEVIGDPISHSKSPLIHRFWLNKLGIQGSFECVRVVGNELVGYLQSRRRDPAWRGCSVTSPYKRQVLEHVDDLDTSARRVGAVNTIVAEDGKLIGYNTDGAGFLEPLGPLMMEEGAETRLAIVLGAGGAARAIAFALESARFDPLVLNRHPETARELTNAAGGPWWDDLSIYDLEANRNLILSGPPRTLLLLVNATNLGMAGWPALDVTLDGVDPRAIVYDIVYSPLETPLLAAARKRGMRTIDGLAMLIGQADRTFNLLFGGTAPREHNAELRELLTR